MRSVCTVVLRKSAASGVLNSEKDSRNAIRVGESCWFESMIIPRSSFLVVVELV